MVNWVVGKVEQNGVNLTLDGAAVTTGTGSISYAIDVAGTTKYLQSDGATFSPIAHTFSVAAGPLGFVHQLTVPESASGYTVNWTMTHSAHGPIGSENHFVTDSDLDDIGGVVDHPGAIGRAV